jgi:hypothetical protein
VQNNILFLNAKGELIELCDPHSKCIKAKEFTVQFMTWSAGDRFVLSGMKYVNNRTGISYLYFESDKSTIYHFPDSITVVYDSLRQVKLGAYNRQFVMWFSIKLELEGWNFY